MISLRVSRFFFSIQVRGGATTWDRGGFGDISLAEARSAGFADEWIAALSEAGASPGRVKIRVTLCDPEAVIESNDH
jgi:hypothetical protein